jgi:hypothetical protein
VLRHLSTLTRYLWLLNTRNCSLLWAFVDNEKVSLNKDKLGKR